MRVQDHLDRSATVGPRGFVSEQSPAVWGMQFVWPIKAEYRIVYLDPDYAQTVIGRSARDYVWLMARTPEITGEEYEQFHDLIRELGYDVTRLRRVPHRWSQRRRRGRP